MGRINHQVGSIVNIVNIVNTGLYMDWKQPIPTDLINVCDGHAFAATVLEKLLLRGRQSDGYCCINHEQIFLKRGQCFCGRYELANCFGLKKGESGRIRNVLNFLQNVAQQITKQKARNGSIITILYFDNYTSLNQSKTNQKPIKNQSETTNKNEENEENEKNKPIGGEPERKEPEPERKEPEPKEPEKKIVPPEKIWELPQSVEPRIWAEFEAHRIEIKKPMSDMARNKNVKFLIGLSKADQQEIVDRSIKSRWTGLFALKLNDRRGDNTYGLDNAIRAVEAEMRTKGEIEGNEHII